MSRIVWKAMLAWGVAWSSIALCADGRARREFPDTSERIVVYADQLPSDLTDAQWKFVATHYAGGQKQTRAWVRKIRQLNPNFLMLHYQLAVGCGPAKFVVGDEWTNDFDDVASRENWFLHDAMGRRLKQMRWDWFVMDIRFVDGAPASGFPQYWVDSAMSRMRVNEDDGTFADSYTQDILMLQLQPAGFAWFADAEVCRKEWLPNLNAYGAFVAKRFADAPERFYFLPNLGGLVTGWDDVTKLDVGDGGMVEGFALPGARQFYSAKDWKLEQDRIITLSRAEKIVLCQTSVDAGDVEGRMFVVCSHLLSKGRRSYLNLIGKSSLEWYPEYEVDLGAADGEMTASDGGTFRRAFRKGEVIVNPGSSPAKVGFSKPMRLVIASGGGAVDEAGRSTSQLREEVVRDVTVPAHGGRIVLFERARD